MIQEFTKTPIIGQQGEIPSRSFFRKTKKSVHSSSFLYYHPFQRKSISYHLDFAKE